MNLITVVLNLLPANENAHHTLFKILFHDLLETFRVSIERIDLKICLAIKFELGKYFSVYTQ